VATPLRAERSESARGAFEARASRAEILLPVPSIDPEPLRFASRILHAQASAADVLAKAHAGRPLTGDLARDLESILDVLLGVPRSVEWEGPAESSASARDRAREDRRTAGTRLVVYWNGDRSAADDWVSRAMLRPYVETLRVLGVTPDRARPPGRCPFCGGSTGIGRRESAESQGSVRTLLCALCGFEWGIPRISCPSCAESAPQRLPSFTSPNHPLVRVEACETCRRYVKTLDTSLDRRILPEIDDLASLALDLWARKEGFERLEPGLAGNG
jgi:hypothetical protein